VVAVWDQKKTRSRHPYHQQHTRCQVSYYGWYGRKLTDVVLAVTGYDASARLEDLTPAHIPHVHDFARDVNLTTEEHIRQSVTSWVVELWKQR
jgi:hypothetical protein